MAVVFYLNHLSFLIHNYITYLLWLLPISHLSESKPPEYIFRVFILFKALLVKKTVFFYSYYIAIFPSCCATSEWKSYDLLEEDIFQRNSNFWNIPTFAKHIAHGTRIQYNAVKQTSLVTPSSDALMPCVISFLQSIHIQGIPPQKRTFSWPKAARELRYRDGISYTIQCKFAKFLS